MGVILLCPHEFDVAVCDVTANNVALSFSLVGYPWTKAGVSKLFATGARFSIVKVVGANLFFI